MGSGSRGVGDAVGRWAADLAPFGLQVVYAGDGQGHSAFAAGTVDFAVDDVPFLGTDPDGHADNDGGRDLTYVPLVGDAVAFAYHVDGAGGPVRGLRLSPRTLLGILTGQITDWADPAITRDNNGRRLPSTAIAPLVPAASSDVTYQLTSWLAARFPGAWAAYAGRPGPVTTYPVPADGTTADPATILDDVAMTDGAIAFVESSQAVRKNATVAEVRNPAGFFVPPTGSSASLALRAATIGADHAPLLSGVYADSDPRAYPISYVDSLFLPLGPADPTLTTPKRQSLANLAMYAVCDEARVNDVSGFAPLPLNLTRAALQQVRRLADVDPGVDVSALDVAHCGSPYLGRSPLRDLLPEQSPLPRACDAAGAGPCPHVAPGTHSPMPLVGGSQDLRIAGLRPGPGIRPRRRPWHGAG